MIRLLKADLYKMFRMPSFWVTTLIAWAYNTFFNCAGFYTSLRDAKRAYEVTGSIINLKSFVPECAVFSINISVTFLAVFVIIFAAAEFSTGTIKNVATKGFMREEIYFSKFQKRNIHHFSQ